MPPQTRSSTNSSSREIQPNTTTITEASSTKRKASKQSGAPAKRLKHINQPKHAAPEKCYNCRRCGHMNIKGKKFSRHMDETCPNRAVQCVHQKWHISQYESRLHGCSETIDGKSFSKDFWPDLEIQVAKLLCLWGELEGNRHLLPQRSPVEIKAISEDCYIRCATCKIVGRRNTKFKGSKCPNGHSYKPPVCAVCSGPTAHKLCGTQKESIDINDAQAVRDYYRMCFRYMPQNVLEELVQIWSWSGDLNEPHRSSQPSINQHEQNVTTAASILENPRNLPKTLFEVTSKLKLSEAWVEFLSNLQKLADEISRSPARQQGIQHIDVDVFAFDHETFRMKKQPVFPVTKEMEPYYGRTFKQSMEAISLVSLESCEGERGMLLHRQTSHMNFMYCKPCDFTTKDEDKFVRHNMSQHPDKSNPTIYTCPICDTETGLESRIHECQESLQDVRLGTRDLFTVYWLKFLKLSCDALKQLLLAWRDLMDPELPKDLSSQVISTLAQVPIKRDLAYYLSVLLRWATRPGKQNSNSCSTLESLQSTAEVDEKFKPFVEDVFSIAEKEREYFYGIPTAGMHQQAEDSIRLEIYGIDLFKRVVGESYDHPEWEKSTALFEAGGDYECRHRNEPLIASRQSSVSRDSEEILEIASCDDLPQMADVSSDSRKYFILEDTPREEYDASMSDVDSRSDSYNDRRESEEYSSDEFHGSGRDNKVGEHSSDGKERLGDKPSSNDPQQVHDGDTAYSLDDRYSQYNIVDIGIRNQTKKVKDLLQSAEEDVERETRKKNWAGVKKAAEMADLLQPAFGSMLKAEEAFHKAFNLL